VLILDNENKNSRVKEFFDYLRSDEFRIKTITTCCIIMAATLVLIAGELYNIYKGINAVTDLLEDGEYNRVSQVFNEEKKPEDVLPILGITSTTESTNDTVEDNNDSQNNEDDKNEQTTKKNTQISSTTSTTTNRNETTTKQQSKTKTYVINKNSKKIHTKDCSFVDRMKEENKQTVQLTSDELNEYINNGYSTCSSCGG
jgi:hypothetical protein